MYLGSDLGCQRGVHRSVLSRIVLSGGGPRSGDWHLARPPDSLLGLSVRIQSGLGLEVCSRGRVDRLGLALSLGPHWSRFHWRQTLATDTNRPISDSEPMMPITGLAHAAEVAPERVRLDDWAVVGSLDAAGLMTAE